MPPSNHTSEELERAQALLPWFANGSLSASDAQWLTQWLKNHPNATDIHTELAWLQKTASQVQSSVELPADDKGLDALLTRIHREKTTAADVQRLAARTPLDTQNRGISSLWSKLTQLMSTPKLGMALTAVVLVQTGLIGTLMHSASNRASSTEQTQNLTPLSGSPLPNHSGALLQLTFVPTTTEAVMRQTLNEAHADIVAGPGALGVYVVEVKANNVDKTIKLLQNKPQVVESVRQP